MVKPRYCFDNSALSNPWDRDNLRKSLFPSVWKFVGEKISDGIIAVTKEIFDEMILIDGGLGDFIKQNKSTMLFEIDQNNWDWKGYIKTASRMQNRYKDYISEYGGKGRKGTIDMNDLTTIALANTLSLPVISMEKRIQDLRNSKKRKIPDICDSEHIEHLTFNDFLENEGGRF